MDTNSDSLRTVALDVRLPSELQLSGGLYLKGAPDGDYRTAVWAEVVIDEDGSFRAQPLKIGDFLTIDELEAIDWRRTIAELVYFEAIRSLGSQLTSVDDDDGQAREQEYEVKADRLWQAQRRASTRRRGGLTPAELEKVAEAYLAGGVEQVAKTMHVGIRQASRYIATAKKEGPLA